MPSAGSLRAQVDRYCRARLPPNATPEIVEWQPLSGGWEHDVYELGLETGPTGRREIQRLVLRLNPREGTGPAVAHEARTLSLLGDAGFRAPRLFAAEASSEVLGAPFLLVEHIEGRLLLEVMPTAVPDDREHLRQGYCALLAQLHDLDWQPFADDHTRQFITVDALLTDARAVCHTVPSLGGALTWLERYRHHIDERRAVLHGDPHLANTLVCDDLTVVLIDWSASGVGDPRIDLSRSMLLIRGYGAEGRRDAFVNTYADLAGPLRDLEWFEVLAAVRHLGMVADRAAADPSADQGGPHAEAAARILAFVERVIAAPPAP